MIANIGFTWNCPACCDFHGRGSALGVAEKNQEVQTLKTPIGSEWPMHNKSAQGHQDPATDLYRRLLSLAHWFASCRASGTITYSADEGQSCHADLPSMLRNLCVVLLPTLWPANLIMAAVFPRPSPLGNLYSCRRVSPCRSISIDLSTEVIPYIKMGGVTSPPP